MSLIRRSFLVLILVCLGCSAQSTPSDLAKKIERQVRSAYSIPSEVNITVGEVTPSTEWPNYDSVTVTIAGGDGKKSDYKFLVSKDRNTMLRLVKFDLSKDPFAEMMSKIDVNKIDNVQVGDEVVLMGCDGNQGISCAELAEKTATIPWEIITPTSERIWRSRDLHLQGLSAGGDSSLGDPRRCRRELPGGAKPRCLLGFRRLHPREPAGGQQ